MGFLWWNTSPAKIFMGDTGSLAIGGAIAGFAILSRTELLLAFIGGLFVLITLSVIIQVGYFKVTKGKRFFKMAPLQHHFELKGWAEVTVVVRFWILGRPVRRRGPWHLLRRMGGPAVSGTETAERTGCKDLVSWDSDWAGLRVVVTGIGVSGFSAADTLIELGARVVVVDAATPGNGQAKADTLQDRRRRGRPARRGRRPLRAEDRRHEAGPGRHVAGLAAGPGPARRRRARPHPGVGRRRTRLARAGPRGPQDRRLADHHRHERKDDDGRPDRVHAAGRRAARPSPSATWARPSSTPCGTRWSTTSSRWSSPASSCTGASPSPPWPACASTSPRTTWTGTAPTTSYLADKAKIYEHTQKACIYNAEQIETERMVEDADVVEGCRAVGFTTVTPAISMLGVVEGLLVDRAFIAERKDSAAELASMADLGPVAPRHMVANALAAAGLVRAYGVSPEHVREGLKAYIPGSHRIQPVAKQNGVLWINDSKATNPHAAAASLSAFDPVVWIAGGLSKGVSYDELVRDHARRLKAVVLIGKDTASLEESLRRHAPDVPVIRPATGHTENGAVCRNRT